MASKAENKNPVVNASTQNVADSFLTRQISAGANASLWILSILLCAVAIFGNYYLNKEYSDVFNDSINSLLKGLGVVLVVLLAVVVALCTNKGRQGLSFAKESYTEVRRVVWPDAQKTKQVTIMVGIIAVMLSLMLWVFDVFFMFILDSVNSI